MSKSILYKSHRFNWKLNVDPFRLYNAYQTTQSVSTIFLNLPQSPIFTHSQWHTHTYSYAHTLSHFYLSECYYYKTKYYFKLLITKHQRNSGSISFDGRAIWRVCLNFQVFENYSSVFFLCNWMQLFWVLLYCFLL